MIRVIQTHSASILMDPSRALAMLATREMKRHVATDENECLNPLDNDCTELGKICTNTIGSFGCRTPTPPWDGVIMISGDNSLPITQITIATIWSTTKRPQISLSLASTTNSDEIPSYPMGQISTDPLCGQRRSPSSTLSWTMDT